MQKEGIPSERVYQQPDLSFWSLRVGKSFRSGVLQWECICSSSVRPQTNRYSYNDTVCSVGRQNTGNKSKQAPSVALVARTKHFIATDLYAGAEKQTGVVVKIFQCFIKEIAGESHNVLDEAVSPQEMIRESCSGVQWRNAIVLACRGRGRVPPCGCLRQNKPRSTNISVTAAFLPY